MILFIVLNFILCENQTMMELKEILVSTGKDGYHIYSKDRRGGY